MRTEVVITGIGGQGIQMMAKTFATGALERNYEVMLSAEYGGEMRGGPSQASVVIGDSALVALPILAQTSSAIVMHYAHGTGTERLIEGGLVLCNSSIVDPETLPKHAQVFSIDATKEANALEAPQSAGLLLMSAYDGLCQRVGIDLLMSAMTALIPPYRSAAIASNVKAMRHGYALGEALR